MLEILPYTCVPDSAANAEFDLDLHLIPTFRLL